jgi:peroxiredoxin Q/BCP
MRNAKQAILFFVSICAAVSMSSAGIAIELGAGDPAPLFTAQTQDGTEFNLADRKGHWTVLYFYPKANTPGCTAQASAFRDSIETIRGAGADVYGISTDTVADQAAFHQEQRLDFTLLADPDGSITEAYGAKMPILTMSRRWTFIIDPSLTIRQVQHDVDPAQDAQRVATEIARLKGEPATAGAPAPPKPEP